MNDPNKHISEFLDYYCSMKEAPEFGVLLKGEWGSGKTWYIKKYIAEKERNAIYVSLYGLTSFSEIEDEFFRQLHPMLASKGMQLAGKVFKSALKATLKFDLDDKKEELAINTEIPSISQEYLTKLDDHILIFDDLERCKIETEIVLGYINHFVEHQGFKVILLAHEDEIVKNTEETYRRIKEKLIGKTFQVAPDLESAINDFIDKLSDAEAKESLDNNKGEIISINEMSKYKNLRVLKQALWDYERIYDALPDNAKATPELVKKVLGLSLAYSLEIRMGKIAHADIPKLNAVSWDRFFQNSAEKKSKDKVGLEEFQKKYGNLRPSEPVPSATFWSEYFETGAINHDELKVSIDNSTFFINKSTPDWIRLWHYRELNDASFDDLLKRVTEEFDEKKYELVGIIKHVVGLLLRLSEIDLFSRDKATILKQGKDLINHLRSNKKLLVADSSVADAIRNAYAGLGFHSAELPEFQAFCNYVDEMEAAVKEENMAHEAAQLLELMKTNSLDFVLTITLSNSELQRYYDTPIFIHTNEEQFLTNFLAMDSQDQSRIVYGFKERYKFEGINLTLTKERDWLNNVATLLERESKNREHKLSGYILKTTSDEFRHMAAKLELLAS